ncbi:MAG: WXG100 family type VII secretion target, partial [Stackebrandtia sp.]
MGDFDSYTLDEIREMVDPDRPDDMGAQADSWTAWARLLNEQAETLESRLEAARPSWTGAASDVFFSEMYRRHDELRDAASTADDNAAAWSRIRDHADYAKSQVIAIHAEWRQSNPSGSGEPGDPAEDERRKPFDERARKVMSDTAGETDFDYRALRFHEPLTPLPDVDDGEEAGSRDGGGSGEGGGSSSGSGSSSSSGGYTSTGGGAAPSLQGVSAPATPT